MYPRHINYSAAYSFADATVSAVRNPESLGSDDIPADFFGFRNEKFFEQIAAPQKITLLHEFIIGVNEYPIQHYVSRLAGDEIIENYEWILEGAGISRPSWFNEKEVQDRTDDLRGILDGAVESIANSAFQLLFSDRTFLFEFGKFIQPYILQLQPDEHPCIAAPGIVARAYFPVWLKNAVFHRDKGRCQLCGCDLTNILVPTARRHIDHMVPLRAGGTNDPTNFQLACESCNTSKGANVHALKHLSYPYW